MTMTLPLIITTPPADLTLYFCQGTRERETVHTGTQVWRSKWLTASLLTFQSGHQSCQPPKKKHYSIRILFSCPRELKDLVHP